MPIRFPCIASAALLLACCASQAQPAAPVGEAPASRPVARPAGPEGNYAARLLSTIQPNLHAPSGIGPGSLCTVDARTEPDGTVAGTKVVASKGDPRWCAAVLQALALTQKLPLDSEGRIPALVEFTFRSEGN